MPTHTRRVQGFGTLVVSLATATYALPILVDIALFGIERIFHYLAADSFYYLTVGSVFAEKGIFSFDQELATNGFHPLWQILLGQILKAANLFNLVSDQILFLVFAVNVVLTCGAIILVGAAFTRQFGAIHALFIAIPVGVYAVIVEPVTPRYGTLWSFTNGMETPLVLLASGVCLLLFTVVDFRRLTSGTAIAVGSAFSLLMLARLDHVFLAVAAIVFCILVMTFQSPSAVSLRDWENENTIAPPNRNPVLRVHLLISGLLIVASLCLWLTGFLPFLEIRSASPVFFTWSRPIAVLAAIGLGTALVMTLVSIACLSFDRCMRLLQFIDSRHHSTKASIVLAVFWLTVIFLAAGYVVEPTHSQIRPLAIDVLIISSLLVVLINVVRLRPMQWIARRQILPLILLLIPVSFTLVLYCTFNWITAGTFLPVSGVAKSTFPHMITTTKILDIVSILRDPSQAYAFDRLWRYAQILLPVLAAVLGIVTYVFSRSSAQPPTRLGDGLAVISLFVLILGAYNFAFVPIWSQGHWYVPLSVLLVSLWPLYFLQEQVSTKPQVSQGTELLVIVVTISFSVLFYLLIYRSETYNQHYVHFYRVTAPEIKAYYGDTTPKIIEYDDGIVAFSTGFPALSGFGLALDKIGTQHKQDGTFIAWAMERGFDRITSLNYLSVDGNTRSASSSEIKKMLVDAGFVQAEELGPYDLIFDFYSCESDFAIFRIITRDSVNSE